MTTGIDLPQKAIAFQSVSDAIDEGVNKDLMTGVDELTVRIRSYFRSFFPEKTLTTCYQ